MLVFSLINVHGKAAFPSLCMIEWILLPIRSMTSQSDSEKTSTIAKMVRVKGFDDTSPKDIERDNMHKFGDIPDKALL